MPQSHNEGSPKGKVDRYDLRKVAVGAGIAAAGAVLAYVTEWLSGQDLGDWGPLVGAVMAVLANFLRKLATDTERYIVLLLIALAVSIVALPALAADIDAPERVDSGNLVVVESKTEGKSYVWFVTGPRGFEKTFRAGPSCVFTGPVGSYLVMLVVATPDGALDQGQATVAIGDAPPVPPTPPGPTPPGPSPPNIPPDRFGNIGQASYAWAKTNGLTPATADAIANDYKAVASALAAGGISSITAANAELRTRREAVIPVAERSKWDAWGRQVGEVWAKHNVAPKDDPAHHPAVIEFYNAVAAGLEAM